MTSRLLAAMLLASSLLPAARNVATAKGENQDVALTVTLYIRPPEIKEVVGDGLEGHYIVAKVVMEPKSGKEVAVEWDDFELSTNKDGDKANPYAASQVAGRSALIIRRSSEGGGFGVGSAGYPIGYPPPVYPGGGPPDDVMRMPGTAVAGVSGGAEQASVSAANDPRGKESPLEKALDEKALREGRTAKPVSGLLYFLMEKQKMKDLELKYGGRANRITLKFK